MDTPHPAILEIDKYLGLGQSGEIFLCDFLVKSFVWYKLGSYMCCLCTYELLIWVIMIDSVICNNGLIRDLGLV